ncbi:hypothetical protein [Kocuria sp. NPDC057446]
MFALHASPRTSLAVSAAGGITTTAGSISGATTRAAMALVACTT